MSILCILVCWFLGMLRVYRGFLMIWLVVICGLSEV